MYAIFEDGSRQYRVSPGDVIDVDRRDLDEGQETIEFGKVLMVSAEAGDAPKIGTPTLEGAKVVAKIGGEFKGAKIYIHKLRRRKGYRRKQGHRQKHLRVTIDEIVT